MLLPVFLYLTSAEYLGTNWLYMEEAREILLPGVSNEEPQIDLLIICFSYRLLVSDQWIMSKDGSTLCYKFTLSLTKIRPLNDLLK